MSPGSRILVLSAVALAGCQSAPKSSIEPLRASVSPTADTRTLTRADRAQPVVNSADFQKPLPVSASPQPNVTPPLHVPTIPSTTFPSPVVAESSAPVPPSAPGLSEAPSPPAAEGSPEGIVMPNLFEKK